MKKIYSLFAIVATLLLPSACTKDGGFAAVEENMTFHATIADNSLKTTLVADTTITGHNNIYWDEDDSVKIIYSTSSTGFKTAAIEEGGEINVKVYSSSNFFAVYPHTATGKIVSTSTVTGAVTVPVEQNGSFEEACMMVAWATNERILRFHKAVSVISIDVEDPEITGIVIRANDSTPLAGQAEFTFDKTTGEITKIVHNKACTPEITLNVSGPGKYYVGVLPNADLKAGIGCKVIKGEKSSAALSRAPLELKTNELMSIGKVEDYVLPDGDIFIKASGFGKGTSWSDAGGLSLLNSLLDSRVSEDITLDGVTMSWILEGKTIFVAQGTYNFTGADMLPLSVTCGKSGLRVYGGYSEGSIGKDTTMYDPALYPTKFTSDEGVRIMEVGGTDGGLMEFRGISFCDAFTSCDGAAVAVQTKAELKLTDCTFEQNTTTKNGAGLYVSGGSVRLNGCSFAQNQGTSTIDGSKEESDAYHYNTSHGGAVFATAKDNAVNLYLDHCTFRNNLAFVGPDIELRYGANAYAYDSAFISGIAQATNYFSIYPGRSINVDAMPSGKTGKLCMCNCTLTKSASGYTTNGGLPVITATNYFLMLVNCTVHDPAVASVRNNNQSNRTSTDPDLVWLIANLIYNESSNGNAINLHKDSNQHGYYNMLRSGKNGYAELAPTDTKILESEYTAMKFSSDKGYYTWSVDESVTTVKKPTKAFIDDAVSTNCADFRAWLYTVSEDPFGLDQIGTLRNFSAEYPGSWDKGI